MLLSSHKKHQILANLFAYLADIWRHLFSHLSGFMRAPFWHIFHSLTRDSSLVFFISLFFVILFPFVIKKLWGKLGQVFTPYISCGHIFALGCLCHFNTLQTLQVLFSLCVPRERQLQSPWSFCDSHFAFFYYPFLTQQRYGVSIFLVGPASFLWSCSRLLKMTARLSSALFLKVNDLLVLLTTFYLDSILCSLFGLIIECFRKVIW